MNRKMTILLVHVLLLTFASFAHADRQLDLVASNCLEGTLTQVACRWSDGSCDRFGGIVESNARCEGARCLTYTVTNTGCKNTACCLRKTTADNACTKFTSPKFSHVTSYLKPAPPDRCGPIACF